MARLWLLPTDGASRAVSRSIPFDGLLLGNDTIGIGKTVVGVPVGIMKNLAGASVGDAALQRALHLRVEIMARIHQGDYELLVAFRSGGRKTQGDESSLSTRNPVLERCGLGPGEE